LNLLTRFGQTAKEFTPKYWVVLGLANSTRMGILKYDVDTTHKLHSALAASALPPGELTFDYIKSAYPYLFEGLGELDEPFSITLNPGVKPIQAATHRYAAPKLPVIKAALDILVNTGQLVRVNKPTPWILNMVVWECPATDIVVNP